MCPSTEVSGTRGVSAQRIWKRSWPHSFGETPQGRGRIAEKGVPLYEFVHAAQIGQTVETLGEGFGNGLIFLVKRVEWLDDVVFPTPKRSGGPP